MTLVLREKKTCIESFWCMQLNKFGLVLVFPLDGAAMFVFLLLISNHPPQVT